MESFTFATPLVAIASCGDGSACSPPAPWESGGMVGEGGGHLVIQQSVSGTIGHKVYPGALAMVAVLEHVHAWLPSNVRVLELGAGVCALPSLALCRGRSPTSPSAPAGTHGAWSVLAVATDVPDMLPQLRMNAVSNGLVVASGEGGGMPPAVVGGGGGGDATPTQRLLGVRSLCWGPDGADDAAAIASWLNAPSPRACAEGGRSVALPAASPPPALILGADVVYHEHLIAPLLDTLLRLTQRVHEGDGGPTIALTYVQRFKRAKPFWRKAARHFHVRRYPLPDVVDYDVLSWLLPLLCQDGEGCVPRLTSRSAWYGDCMAALAAFSTSAASCTATSCAPTTPTPVHTTVYHAVDSEVEGEGSCDEGALPLLAAPLAALDAKAVYADRKGGGGGGSKVVGRGDGGWESSGGDRLSHTTGHAVGADGDECDKAGGGTDDWPAEVEGDWYPPVHAALMAWCAGVGGRKGQGVVAPTTLAAAVDACERLGVSVPQPCAAYLYVLRRRAGRGGGGGLRRHGTAPCPTTAAS